MTFNLAFAKAHKEKKKYFKFNGRTYTTEIRGTTAPTVVGYDQGRVRQGIRGAYNTQTEEVETTLPEITVNAPRAVIDPNKPKTMFGLLPTGERLYQDYVTGQTFITDNRGNIIATSMADLPTLYMHYYPYLQSTADRQAAITGASDLLNLAVALVGNRPSVTTEQLATDIRNARSGFANAVNGIVNVPNHAIMGGIRVVAGDPNYSKQEYVNGFVNPSIENLTIGIGDALGVQNPFGNFVLNMANPTSMFLARPTETTSKIAWRQGKPVAIPVAVEEFPVGKRGTRVSAGTKGSAKGTPIRTSSKYGYTTPYHNVASYSHDYSGPKAGNIRWTLQSMPTLYPVFVQSTTPGQLIPTMYYRSGYETTPAQTVTVLPDKGHTEIVPMSPFLAEWIRTGEMPRTNATKWNQGTPEGVFNTNNTYWRGLNGTGRRYGSALMNTFNNGQGYTTQK